MKFQKKRIIEKCVFAILLIAYVAVTFFLFNRQTHSFSSVPDGNGKYIVENNIYPSDMGYYVLDIEGLQDKYSYPYPVFFVLSKIMSFLLDARTGMALVTALLNGAAVVLVRVYLEKLLVYENDSDEVKLKTEILISIGTISLFVLSMLYPPKGIYLPGILFKYVGVFTPNPFHNATYLAARPFAIVAFFSFAELLGRYEKDEHPDKAYFVFAAALLLATMTKPSYTILHVGTAGMIMLWRLIKGKNLKAFIMLGIMFIPTFLDLLYQYSGVFINKPAVDALENEKGIGIGLGDVWNMYCGNIPLAVLLIVGFPVLVFVLEFALPKLIRLYERTYNEKLKNVYALAIYIFIAGFLTNFFLYEKGFRKKDFNFAWGYMYGAFFAFVGALVILINASKGIIKEKTRISSLFLVAEWAALFVHVVCGVIYLYDYLLGRSYF